MISAFLAMDHWLHEQPILDTTLQKVIFCFNGYPTRQRMASSTVGNMEFLISRQNSPTNLVTKLNTHLTWQTVMYRIRPGKIQVAGSLQGIQRDTGRTLC